MLNKELIHIQSVIKFNNEKLNNLNKRVKDYFITGIQQQSQVLNKPEYLEVQKIDNARANFYKFVKRLFLI